MSSTRKKISIYDYPEHLNPFSEPTVPLRKTKTGRASFVNRLSMDSTWSSKISKRVNRSVTWIEKSWLGIEDSKKYRIQPSIVGGSTGNIYDNTPRNSSESLNSTNLNEKSNYDYQQVREQIRKTIVNPNEMNTSSTKPEEEGKEIKKKKKRPAPQPPSVTRDTSATPIENSTSKSDVCATSNEKNEEVENSPTDTCMKHRSISDQSVEKISYESEKELSDVNCRTSNDPSADESTLLQCEYEKDPDVPLDQCNVSPNRPNRLHKNTEDGAVELLSSPKKDKGARYTSTDRSNSQDNDEDISGDSSIEVEPKERELDETITTEYHCEKKVEENCSTVIDKCNGKVVQV